MERIESELLRGWLHLPALPNGKALALFHGAGSNCDSKLLIAVAEAFAAAGWAVYRGDLPYRQLRPTGPPLRDQARDRAGIRAAIDFLATRFSQVYVGGHSYGGRQASMLAAEDPSGIQGLLLLSYPLHPPRKSAELRTAHFPTLRVPALFVHGTRDPFGSPDEMSAGLALIPGKTQLALQPGLGHELHPRITPDLPALLAA